MGRSMTRNVMVLAMRVARWMECLALLTATVSVTVIATATASADPPAKDTRLDGCKGLPARGRIARAESIGEDAVFAVTTSGDRYLVFPQQDGGCEVFPFGAAA